MDKGNGKLLSHEVRLTALDRPTEIEFLHKLGARLNAGLVEGDASASADAVIEKLCDLRGAGGAPGRSSAPQLI
jgi:hypothetical protein